MKHRLMDLLVCPGCGGVLALKIFQSEKRDFQAFLLETSPCKEYCSFQERQVASSELMPHCQPCYQEEITEGSLVCTACGSLFPIINGIPRLLGETMRDNLYLYHASFFKKHGKVLLRSRQQEASSSETRVKSRTLRSFSFQWNTFSEMFDEYREHWKAYLPTSLTESFFAGKLGLDAGCGFGRHIFRAASAAKKVEMVGIDLSEAVEAAYRNTAHLPNVHIVQSDIYDLPFPKGRFDFIYSLGVLHHLPRPADGFRSLANLLKPGQAIFIWCYDDEKPLRLALYESMRKFTVRLPFRALYVLCYVPALGIRFLLNYPAGILRRMPKARRLADKIPYGFYGDYPLRMLHADLFDVFSVPSTRYYSLNELTGWYETAGVSVQETHHSVSGWTLFGTKSANSK